LRNTKIEDYHGPFAEWEIVQEERTAAAAAAAAEAEAEWREQERRRAKRAQRSEREARADRRSGEAAVAEAETRVHALEAEVAQLETALQDPSLYGTPEGVSRSVALNAELAAAREALESALAEWIDLAEGEGVNR